MGLSLKKEELPLEQNADNGSRPNIFSFHDYRAFIEKWAAWQSKHNTGISIRSISLKAGLSDSYLRLVVRGHRNLTKDKQKRLLDVLGLNKEEEAFFNALVQLADAKSKDARLQAITKMHRFKKFRDAEKISSESYKYLSNWYYVAIREMVSLPGFKLEPKWIQKRLSVNVPLKKIEKAISFLIKYKYIQLNEKGKIVSNQPALDCSGGIYKVALREFHQQMFELVSQVSETAPRDLRLEDANTFAVSDDDIPAIKNILTSAIDQVVDYMNKKSSSSKDNLVYHVAFTGFPLTKKENEK